MANYITLGFNILCIVLIFFGMFWGIIRGLNKTVSRLFFLIITGIILLFVTIPLTNLLLQIPLNVSMVGLTPENGVDTLPIIELIPKLLEGFLGQEFVTKYPEFSELLITIPLALIYAIVFLVLFWLCKLLLLPINALLTKLIFHRRKPREELGFSAMNDDSDNSLQPLMDVYKQAEASTDNSTFTPTTYAEGNTNNFAVTEDNVQVDRPRSKKELKKERKAYKKANKPKKHRWWGCLVGMGVGVALIFYTMVPFYGILNIAETVKNTKINHLTEEPTSADTLTNGMLTDIIKGYELSALGRISQTIGLESLGLMAFDHLTSATINDHDIVLREDVNAIVKTITQTDALIGAFKTASDKGLSNLTQQELTDLIDSTDSVITTCSEIKFVDAMSDYILPLTYELLKSQDIQIVDDPIINELIIEMLADLVEESGINVFAELRSVVGVAKYINDQGLLHPIVTGNTSTILNVIHDLDDDFGTQFSNKLFAIKAVDTVLPQILDIGLQLFDSVVDFGYVENTATKDELKESMTQLITSIVDTARTLSYDSEYYITGDTIIKLGGVLDTFRNSKLFNIETYNNLVDYTINQVKGMLNEALPVSFSDVVNNKILRNVTDITDWEEEMTIIYNSIQLLGDTSTLSFDNLAETTIINIGKMLDCLEKSKIFGTAYTIDLDDTDYNNTTLVALISATLNEVYASMAGEEESSMTAIFDIINNMRVNLVKDEHTYTDGSTYWQTEMTAISKLVIQIMNIAESSDFELSTELGAALDDCAHESVMLGGDTTLVFMEKLMAIVQDTILGEDFTPAGDDSLEDKMYDLIVAIRTNLKSNELYQELQSDEDFWETEITTIISLANVADNANNVTTISGAVALAEDLDKIYTSKIIPTTAINETIAAVLQQLNSGATTGIEGKINSLIDSIATDITSDNFFTDKTKTDFWTIELGYISSLTEIQFEDGEGYSVIDSLSTIGATIDDIVFGDNDTRGSYLITENRIRDILSAVVSDMSADIASGFTGTELNSAVTNALTTIATNLYSSGAQEQKVITSFETELGNLSKLAKLDIGGDLFTYTNDPVKLQQLEDKLTSIGSSLDSIAYNTKTDGTIKFDESKNSNIITRSTLSSIISAAFSAAKISAGSGELSTIATAFNQLITDMQTSIATINTSNKVMTWARELSYVSTLIQLNSGAEFTLENAATDIGENLDKIAFNHTANAFLDVEYNASNEIVGKYVTKEVNDTDPDNVITTYHNSVVINRDMLKAAINAMVAEFKVQTPANKAEEIANELVDNLTTKVATTAYSTTLYNDYKTALTELNTVKTTISDLVNAEITDLDTQTITLLDTTLDGLESKIICGTATTRKIAVMIVEAFKINEPSSEEEIMNEVIDNLINNINNGLVTDYAAVFTELKDIKDGMTEIVEMLSGDIESLAREAFAAIDTTLASFQTKSICGVKTTRKFANLVVESFITEFTYLMSTEVGTYLNELNAHYETGINSSSTTEETYVGSSGTYVNPMATLYDTVQAIINQQ